MGGISLSVFFGHLLYRQEEQGGNSQAPSVQNNGTDMRLPFSKGVTRWLWRARLKRKKEKEWGGADSRRLCIRSVRNGDRETNAKTDRIFSAVNAKCQYLFQEENWAPSPKMTLGWRFSPECTYLHLLVTAWPYLNSKLQKMAYSCFSHRTKQHLPFFPATLQWTKFTRAERRYYFSTAVHVDSKPRNNSYIQRACWMMPDHTVLSKRRKFHPKEPRESTSSSQKVRNIILAQLCISN